MLEFRILGPLAVTAAGQPVAVGGAKQRALLAVLLLHRGQPLSGDRLIDLLWGERAPATAPAALRVHVANLRKTLGPDVVLTERGGYLLAADAFEVDADRFAALAQDGRTALAAGDPSAARKLLGDALGLWRGEPLADMGYEQFAQSDIARLSEARMGAMEDRVEADLALGRHRSLVGEAEALVGQHPDRERLLGQLMLALYRSGRQTDALEAYRKGRLALREEFGLELSPDLRELEQRILDHDAALRPPRASPPGSGLRARRGRLLVIGGGVLLLAVAAAVASLERGGGAVSIRAAPNTVAVINTRTDRVIGAIAVGARPGPVTFAAGSLWVANQDDQTVSRIDPATLTEISALSLTGASLAGTPTALAAGGGGVWVATSGANQSFVSAARIDPQFDQFSVTTRIGSVVPNAPVSLATDAADVWVAPNTGDLTRLDPSTGHVTSELDPNAGPVGIAAGDGAVWLSDNQAGTVTRVDPTTGLITPIPVGRGPVGIAVGDGAVWVAAAGEGKVVRVDPATRSVVATIPVGDTPSGLAVGDGSVWVANSADGTVSRIDPAGNRVIATIAVGGSPQQVTVASGRAWVTVDRAVVSDASGPPRGASARFEAARDVDTLDPAFAYTPLSWQLLYASCAKLLNYPDKPGLAGAELVPEVAQSLPTRSADGRAYTFTIRPGFRFSPPSDQVVTAQTFKYTIMRALDPRMKNPAASEFDDIVGARAFIAGKATAIAGVTTSGNRLTIRLTAPAPDLPARLAQPFFCAVPIGTPKDPNGIRAIPMAGPYEIASYAPGQGIVLVRNPNYHGDRPHSLKRIEVRVNVPGVTAISRVERGTADYAVDGEVDAGDAAELAARYGAGSRAARAGRQQYFVNPARELDFLNLNTHRPLFADASMRLAANYAIDRRTLAQLGGFTPLPDKPAESYLPPGVPGYTDVRPYPSTPNLAKATALALGHRGQTAVLYVCEGSPCDQQGEVIKRDLEAIGLRVEVKAFPLPAYFIKQASSESYDLSWVGWAADYPDPEAILNLLLETPTQLPTFNDSGYRARLAAAAELSGPERFLAYAKLDADLVGGAAPWVVYGNASSHDFFSARIGCQTYGVYGIDIAALCLRTRRAS